MVRMENANIIIIKVSNILRIVLYVSRLIINDDFYDNMIKNNKYYLPFNDCIYSFLDKKTYTYKELPNIHFTYKINRTFPKFDKNDYDDLMNKVIIPIILMKKKEIITHTSRQGH